MTPLDSLREKREAILRIAAEHGARNVRVFGSVARGDATGQSDIDFLVEMTKGRSLWDLIGFWQDVEDFLGVKVDVVTDGGISPYLEEKILAEAIPL
ncbi:MAG: nucleotidyltransferase family protein [Candidatus Zixiibacteriota bacterium]